MQKIISLPELFKRDTKGKVRSLIIQYGFDGDSLNGYSAGVRSISGLQDGKKITSVWNMSEPTNVGKVNERDSLDQADFEAKADHTKKKGAGFFEDIALIDTFAHFKPMLAHDFTKKPVTSGYTQPKLDGIRCLASADGLYSRSFKEIVAVPHIQEAIDSFCETFPGITLDGELYNHELKSDFQKITSLVRKTANLGADELAESKELVQYHVYDCFDANNTDMPFIERYEFLKMFLPVGVSIKLVDTHDASTPADIDELYGKYTSEGYEGQMVRQNTAYEGKRSNNLLKRKEFITEEYKVVEVIEGQGAWTGYAKRFVLELADGTQFGSGVRGNQAQLKELLETVDKPTWATCRYFELSNDGVPRFPVVIDYGQGVRAD
tara:strand:+ start:3173 stop:4309 length:1137 start_codon:yes stop_codon:yes gene_type:complete